jgi:hypothetical protein
MRPLISLNIVMLSCFFFKEACEWSFCSCLRFVYFENIWRYFCIKGTSDFPKRTKIKYYQTILSYRFNKKMYISFGWNKQYIQLHASKRNICAICAIYEKKISVAYFSHIGKKVRGVAILRYMVHGSLGQIKVNSEKGYIIL